MNTYIDELINDIRRTIFIACNAKEDCDYNSGMGLAYIMTDEKDWRYF